MTPLLRVALCQTRPALGDVDANLRRLSELVARQAERGADVVVVPECALHGYVFASREAAAAVALDHESEAVAAIGRLAGEHRVAVVCGFVEADGADLFNTTAVALPGERTAFYRKSHLPALGVDRWATPGPDCGVAFAFRGVRFGVLVCYDLRFPEASRVLALLGIEVLLLPTNWPEGYEATADHAGRTRAWENRVWLLAANRVGVEDGTRFIGRSLAVDPFGAVVAQAGPDDEEALLVEVDPALARSKLLGGGGQPFDMFASRRPELYGSLRQARP